MKRKKIKWDEEIRKRCELAEYYTKITGRFVSYGQISLLLERNIKTF